MFLSNNINQDEMEYTKAFSEYEKKKVREYPLELKFCISTKRLLMMSCFRNDGSVLEMFENYKWM